MQRQTQRNPMNRHAMLIGTVALVCSTIVSAAVTAQPGDARIQAAIEAYEQSVAQAPDRFPETLAKLADEAIRGLDLAQLQLDQARMLLDGANLMMYSTRWRELYDCLEELGAPRTSDGATALVYRLGLLSHTPGDPDLQRQTIESFLSHPALGAALRDPQLWNKFMNFTWYVRPQAVKGIELSLIALGDYIPEENLTVLGVLGAVAVFDILTVSDPEGYDQREPLRLAVVNALERTLNNLDPEDTSLTRWNFGSNVSGWLQNHITRLNGPAARGRLLGHPAPELDFLWVSGNETFRSLEDLHGQIVVMDFWATWCGPCIASFPNMRELVDHYEGLPVQFLGVTSLQGAHYGQDGRVDCADDSEKEFALMSGFMEWKEMTWPVVFTRQPVYNPDYDIRGIPSVVIIDAKGQVRHHKLHPQRHHDLIKAHIDELLREAGGA